MVWLDEIKQQPEALRDFCSELKENGSWVEKVSKMNFKKVLLTGMGSSLFACGVAECYLRKNGIFATSLDSENVMNTSMSLIDDETLVVAISQSGESPEVVKLTGMIKNKDNLIVIVNYKNSRVYNCGGTVIPVCCGLENYSSSKSYTNTLAAVIAFAKVFVAKKDVRDEVINGLLSAAKETERIFETEIGKEFGEALEDTGCLYCVGGGYAYTSATHMELIGEETAKFYGSRYTPGQFIHGPIELIRPGFNVLSFNTQPDFYESMAVVCNNVVEYGGKVLMVTDNREIKATDKMQVFYVDFEEDIYASIVEIVPFELAYDYYTIKNGGKPGFLSRVVKRIVK